MAKYSKGAQKDVESAMKQMEKGKLKSGKSNKKVTNPKQAIAIGLSEAKKKGAKVPAKKGAAKKAAPKKATAKKSIPKKVAVKKKQRHEPAAKKTIKSKNIPLKNEIEKKFVPVEEETVNKAANINNDTDLPPVEEKSPVLVPEIEDPLLAEDRKLMAKATAKADPKNNMRISSINKGSVKPSGKKPLWNR